MEVLVVAPDELHEAGDGAAETLRQLGCRVRVISLWESLTAAPMASIPAAILVEAGDYAEVGRAVIRCVRDQEDLRGLPVILAVSVRGLSCLKPEDDFDDVILRPYVAPELVLRIRAAEWRRSERASAKQVQLGELCIDLSARSVSRSGDEIALTPQEFELLRFLSLNPGQVFTRGQLLKHAWGIEVVRESRTVDIHVRRLRQKLGLRALETVHGVGYRMQKKNAAP